jgi:hypothetical protein
MFSSFFNFSLFFPQTNVWGGEADIWLYPPWCQMVLKYESVCHHRWDTMKLRIRHWDLYLICGPVIQIALYLPQLLVRFSLYAMKIDGQWLELLEIIFKCFFIVEYLNVCNVCHDSRICSLLLHCHLLPPCFHKFCMLLHCEHHVICALFFEC